MLLQVCEPLNCQKIERKEATKVDINDERGSRERGWVEREAESQRGVGLDE